MSPLEPDYRFYEAPAIHPDLADPARRNDLAERWRSDRQVRVESVLEPGLAAEIATVVSRMPLSAVLDGRELSWRCVIETTRAPDPQTYECLHRLVRFIDVDLPELVGAMIGAPVRSATPSRLDVRAIRKGSYRDAGGLDGDAALGFMIGIAAPDWPAGWGGHPELGGTRRSPGVDTLDLFEPAALQIPLLTRAVESIAVFGELDAAP